MESSHLKGEPGRCSRTTYRRSCGNPTSPCGKWRMLACGTSKLPNRRDSTRTGWVAPDAGRCSAMRSAVLAIADLLPKLRGIGEAVLACEPCPLIVLLDRAEDFLAEDAHLRRRREPQAHLPAA